MSNPSSITISGRKIGPGNPCYVIAEIGINHDGSVDKAKQLIDAAKQAGADAVKFQHRYLEDLYPSELLADPCQGEQCLQYLIPHLLRTQLTDFEFIRLATYCRQIGIIFLCTPWSERSVDFLETLDVPAYKIGSPDLTNTPLIQYAVSKGKPLILSTGMATGDEIHKTVDLLRRGTFALLHCVSSYPVASEDLNLRFIGDLRFLFAGPVGFSSHIPTVQPALTAVALGASIVEQHLTLDQHGTGPDHRSSMNPTQFASLVDGIREVEASLGNATKQLTAGERLNRRALGKSLVAAKDLEAGVRLVSNDIAVRGPGLGLSPQHLSALTGCRLQRNMKAGEPFLESDATTSYGIEHRGNGRPKIHLPFRWGIVARFTDAEQLVPAFLQEGLSLVEYHLTIKDLEAGLVGFYHRPEWGQVIVHAPEYLPGDRLFDLCHEQTAHDSIVQLGKVCQLAADLGKGLPSKPRVVFHAGGMSQGPVSDVWKRQATEQLWLSVTAFRRPDVELLLENLPPYPWYFGGRWYGHIMTDPETVARVCKETGLGLCFDTSHAALWCRAHFTPGKGGDKEYCSLLDYAERVKPHVKHLHVSDAQGVAEEGLGIGEGCCNFEELLSKFDPSPYHPVTLIPEIWMGHHNNGAGFRTALERLSEMMAGKEAAHA